MIERNLCYLHAMITTDETTSELSRRDRKRVRTRKQIQEVATKLIRERGYDAVTIVDIAEMADVDVSTFWRHFRSKAAIITSDSEEWVSHFRVSLSKVSSDLNPIDACIEALVASADVSNPGARDLRDEVLKGDPSQEVLGAIKSIEDMYHREMGLAIALRLGVTVNTSPTPMILAGAILGAANWVRENSDWSTLTTEEDRRQVSLGHIVRQALSAGLA